jgi:hypothetical protein
MDVQLTCAAQSMGDDVKYVSINGSILSVSPEVVLRISDQFLVR